MQDMYANSQQMASGIQGLLGTALTEGRAIVASPALVADPEHDEVGEEEEELSVGRLSNAALLASSILATHGAAEVQHHDILLPDPLRLSCLVCLSSSSSVQGSVLVGPSHFRG